MNFLSLFQVAYSSTIPTSQSQTLKRATNDSKGMQSSGFQNKKSAAQKVPLSETTSKPGLPSVMSKTDIPATTFKAGLYLENTEPVHSEMPSTQNSSYAPEGTDKSFEKTIELDDVFSNPELYNSSLDSTTYDGEDFITDLGLEFGKNSRMKRRSRRGSQTEKFSFSSVPIEPKIKFKPSTDENVFE